MGDYISHKSGSILQIGKHDRLTMQFARLDYETRVGSEIGSKKGPMLICSTSILPSPV